MNILFLCTGNSCRSQMAEGWTKALAGADIEVFSAGLESHGKNFFAIQVMSEEGVDISQQESLVVTDTMIDRADIVVTVCGHADEHCPLLPVKKRKIHWPLSDPAKAKGSESEVLAVFRNTRDEVRKRVEDLLSQLRKNYD